MSSERPRILIVGFGDVGARLVAALPHGAHITALVRRPERARDAKALGVETCVADLDDPVHLCEAILPADIVLHLAPPRRDGESDSRTVHLLSALSGGVPRRFVYVSTTGVYGDCKGAWIDESQPLNPMTDRARRRVDAETRITQWCTENAVSLTILRVPGIYALDRLPLERLEKGLPALVDAEDVYSNHIHADDLANVIAKAAIADTSWGVVNVVDDEPMKMGAYFDLVADHFDLPRPPRVSAAALDAAVSPMMRSFMSESRRIHSLKLRHTLGVVLQHPSVRHFLGTITRDEIRPQ